MAAQTTYLADALMAHSLGKTAYTMPTTYIALMTTASTQAGGGTEATYTGYSRVALGTLLGTPSANSTTNASAVTFGACTGGTSTIVGFTVYDASTGGNALWFGACSLSVSSGITPSFAAGALTFTLN